MLRGEYTFKVGAVTVELLITADRHGSRTVNTNDVVPVVIEYTIPLIVTEFTCIV